MSHCYHHPEVEAVGYCRQCGKALCPDCKHEIRGVIYCEDCLAALATGTAQADPSRPPVESAPNPALAAILGFIPGVGAIYTGEYIKALLYILIFAGTISMLEAHGDDEPFLVIFLIAFIFFMPFDAYRSAAARTKGQPPPLPINWPGGGMGAATGESSPVGPILLIALGTVFLMSSIGLFNIFGFVFRLWPLALIALGTYMIWQRTSGVR